MTTWGRGRNQPVPPSGEDNDKEDTMETFSFEVEYRHPVYGWLVCIVKYSSEPNWETVSRDLIISAGNNRIAWGTFNYNC